MQLLDLKSSLLLLVPVDPPPMALLDPRHSARQLLGHHFRLAMSLLSLKVRSSFLVILCAVNAHLRAISLITLGCFRHFNDHGLAPVIYKN